MEYLVAIDGASPIGAFLLSFKGKIGGASSTLETGGVVHAVINVQSLDWSKLPTFVGMTHLQNPGAEDPIPRELVIPSKVVLAVVPVAAPGAPPPAEQQTPPSSLH